MYSQKFVFYQSVRDTTDKVEKFFGEDAAYNLYKAITNFGLYGVLPEEEDKVWAYGFDALAASIASAQKRYGVAVENGKKGGRPKAQLNEEEVIKKYNELNNWDMVAEYFGITSQTLRNRRKEWEEQKKQKNLNNNKNKNSNKNIEEEEDILAVDAPKGEQDDDFTF